MRSNHHRVRVLLADDHQILLDGLREVLSEAFEVVGCAAGGCELLTLARKLKPEIIIADIAMPDLDGVEAILQLRAEGISARVIFLTMLSDGALAFKAFQAGGEAAGFVLKNSAGVELISAIQEVLAGRTYITPRIAGGLLHACAPTAPDSGPVSPSDAAGLTVRQAEVLRLIAQGKTMKEVAAALNISTRTAEAHKYQMMDHLGIKTIAQLVQHAIQHGIVTLAPVALEKDSSRLRRN